MKKKTFALLAIVAFVVMGIIINACSKSEKQVPAEKNYTYHEFTPEKSEVIPLIKTFTKANDHHNLGYKSGEELPLNESLWDLEAGLNYELCEQKDGINNLIVDSTFFVLPVEFNDEGEPVVSMEDLLDIFANLLIYTENALNAGEENYKFVLADVKFLKINNENAELKMTVLGGLYSPYNCNISSGDYWYNFDGLGRCNNLSPTYVGLDAMHRLNNLINCAKPYCSTGTPFYYGIEILENGGALGGYADGCINPQHLLDALNDDLALIQSLQPPNKTFLSCISIQVLITGGPPPYYSEDLYISYGYFECVGGGD